MKGPPPKDPRTRARRNKATTAAKLSMGDGAAVSGRLSPALPERSKNETPWHQETIEFWTEVWASPMAAEYVAADVPGLILLAKLMDRFNYGEENLAAEIRLQRQCFGLTPLDRRRLQWEIDRGESAESRRKKRATPKCQGKRDPRSVLRAVK